MARNRDPFSGTLMAEAAVLRLAGAAVLLVLLWLAVGWAVSLP